MADCKFCGGDHKLFIYTCQKCGSKFCSDCGAECVQAGVNECICPDCAKKYYPDMFETTNEEESGNDNAIDIGSCTFTMSLNTPSQWSLMGIDMCHQQEEETVTPQQKILKPFEIKAKLDEYVIGQEEAKTVLSVAAYNHYQRISYNPEETGVELQKSNVLLVGKSGSGKTLLASTLAKILDVPFVSADVTDFTPAGIVGRDISDIIKDLIKKAGDDKERALRGIVFIDEIDKMAGAALSHIKRVGTGGSVMSSEIQSSFLKLLEGKEIVEAQKSMWGGETTFNTKDILFICAGAFDGIYNEEKANNMVGFSQMQYAPNIEIEKTKITAEDIIEYGLMPEIVGRIPVIVTLDTLTRDNLVHILTEPKNAIVTQYRTMLNMEGVSLEIGTDALEAIAEKVLKNRTGARGLRSVLEDVMTKIMFQVTQQEDAKKCTITRDTVNGADPIIV